MTGLWRYWNSTRRWTEGQARATEFIAQADSTSADRAEALLGLGIMAKNQGAFAVSATASSQSRDLFRELGDRAGESAALTNLQIVLVNRLQLVAAGQVAEEALALGQSLGSDLGAGIAHTNIAPVLGFLGEFARAERSLATSIDLLRRAGAAETWFIAAYTFRAWLGLWRHDLAAVRAALTAAEALLHAHPQYLDDDHLPTFRGDLHLREGDPATAVTLLTAAVAALRRTHSLVLFNALALLGLAHWRQGERAAAVAAWRDGFALRQAIPSDFYGLVLLASLTIAVTEVAEPSVAARLLGAIEAICRVSRLTLRTIARPEHDDAVATTRAALGDAAFARAQAAGAALTLDELLAGAPRLLDGIDAPMSSPN